MTQIEKIKAEIERLKNELSYNKERLNLREIIAVNNCYNNLILFINSLEEEPVSNDLEEESKKYSSCIYLEEVLSDGDKEVLKERLINTFKAGAQWQKERDQSTIELAEDHAYLAGQEKILAKACDWLENYFKGVPSGTVYLEDFKKAIKE